MFKATSSSSDDCSLSTSPHQCERDRQTTNQINSKTKHTNSLTVPSISVYCSTELTQDVCSTQPEVKSILLLLTPYKTGILLCKGIR